MTIDNDDQLLNSLGRVFASDLAHLPNDAELGAFRAMVAAPVDGSDIDDAVVVSFLRPPRRPMRSRGRQVVIGGTAVLVGLSGVTAAAAAANDGVLPRPARIVAHAVGLPVDSVAEAAAKQALKRVREADEASLRGAVQAAEESIAALSPVELTDLGDEAERVLDGARGRLAGGPADGDSTGVKAGYDATSPVTTEAPNATQPIGSPATTEAGEDGGDGDAPTGGSSGSGSSGSSGSGSGSDSGERSGQSDGPGPSGSGSDSGDGSGSGSSGSGTDPSGGSGSGSSGDGSGSSDSGDGSGSDSGDGSSSSGSGSGGGSPEPATTIADGSSHGGSDGGGDGGSGGGSGKD